MRGLTTIEVLTPAIERLETVASAARQALEMALSRTPSFGFDSVEMSAKPSKNSDYNTVTTDNFNPPDTVIALYECSFWQGQANLDDGNGATKPTGAQKLREDRGYSDEDQARRADQDRTTP